MSAIALEPELGIESAARLHAQLAPAVDLKRQVVLDAHSVSRLHAASMQVLVAFVRERRDAGRKTRFNDPTAELRQAANALGVGTILGLDP